MFKYVRVVSHNDHIDFLSLGGKDLDFSPLGNNPTQEQLHNAINQILVKARTQAIDEDTEFQAAALVEVQGSDGDTRYYVDVNLQEMGSMAVERHCAERRAIKHALSEDRHAKVKQLWFLGGLTDGKKLVPDFEKGKRYSPCGACLQIIHDHRLNTATQVHMLPLNDGKSDLVECQAHHLDQSDLPENGVVSKSIKDLFPYPLALFDDPQGHLKKMITEGYESLKSGSLKSLDQVERAMALENLRDVPAKKVLFEVNRLMQKSLRRTYQSDSDQIQKLSSAVVRLNDGSYRIVSLAATAKKPSTIAPEFGAITAGVNENSTARITDIFATRLNFEKLDRQIKKWDKQPDMKVKLSIPKGDSLMRIFKFSEWNASAQLSYADGSPYLPEQGAKVHVIPLNNIKNFDETFVFSRHIMELMPTPYVSPRHKED